MTICKLVYYSLDVNSIKLSALQHLQHSNLYK